MKFSMISAYMRQADIFAHMSKAQKRKVGCVIVVNDIVFPGYNGTPPGWDNQCEEACGTVTKGDVYHAEENALDKIAKSTLSSVGGVCFVTAAPCLPCAKRLNGAGIVAVYYRDVRDDTKGLEFLARCGIKVRRFNE